MRTAPRQPELVATEASSKHDDLVTQHNDLRFERGTGAEEIAEAVK